MISIVIVNYNVKRYLEQCIQTICNSIVDVQFEVVIVDNNSNQSISHLSKKNIKIFNLDENVGFSSATNYGISKSLGDYILLLNPDTLIQDNTINILYNYLNGNNDVGVVGCKVLNSDGSYQLSSKRRFPHLKVLLPLFLKLDKIFPKSNFFGSYNYTHENHDNLLDVDSVSGSCMMFRKKIFKNVGKFDENYFLYFEDTDFCLRVKKNNFRVVYNPNTSVIHYKGESLRTSNYDIKNEFYNSMIYFFKKYQHEYPDWFLLSKVMSFIKILRKSYNFLNNNKSKLISMFYDCMILFLSFNIILYSWFNFQYQINLSSFDLLFNYWYLLLIIIFSWLLSSKFTELYYKSLFSLYNIFLNLVISFFLASTFTYFISSIAYSRVVLSATFLFAGILTYSWRLFVQFYYSKNNTTRGIFENYLLKRTIIIGVNSHSIHISEKFIKAYGNKNSFFGFVKDEKINESYDDLKVLGDLSEISLIVTKLKINEIIIAQENMSVNKIISIFEKLINFNITYKISPYGKSLIIGKGEIENFSATQLFDISLPYMNRFNLFIKRIFDVVFSFIFILITLPLQIFLLFFFTFKPVVIWGVKGRKINKYLLNSKKNQISNLFVFYNILFGSMSFVGTNNLLLSESENPNLLIKPGLFICRDLSNNDIQNISKLDLYYMQNHSLLYDLEIIIKYIFKI